MEEKAPPLKCYSMLRRLLFEKRMTVADLQRVLAKRGFRVNVKTLYRLADPTAMVERLDTEVAGRLCEALKVDLSRLLAFESVRDEIGLRRLPPVRQRRLDRLLEKQAKGRLGRKERGTLQALVEEAERLTVSNAKMLARARAATAGSR
jgi:hypothetical protein